MKDASAWVWGEAGGWGDRGGKNVDLRRKGVEMRTEGVGNLEKIAFLRLWKLGALWQILQYCVIFCSSRDKNHQGKGGNSD